MCDLNVLFLIKVVCEQGTTFWKWLSPYYLIDIVENERKLK